jgi:hypothetical protein
MGEVVVRVALAQQVNLAQLYPSAIKIMEAGACAGKGRCKKQQQQQQKT